MSREILSASYECTYFQIPWDRRKLEEINGISLIDQKEMKIIMVFDQFRGY